jgi:uncharacterized membrane protein YqgA involved in biofilm formation
MIGLGTFLNCAMILAGGILGLLFGNFLNERIRKGLNDACGLAVMFLGIGGAVSSMLTYKDGTFSTQGSLMLTGSLCIGVLIGEILDLEKKMEEFGNWLKKRSGNAKDPQFVHAFVNASLTVCIGAMAIVGSIQDGISGDWSILALKG